MASLEVLKEKVLTCGETVKNLKDGGDKAAIAAAVKDLLAAKQEYADNNNGIGVDGKPYEPPMTKAEKKAKERAVKAAAAGPAKMEKNPNSENAKKKAAKKAAKAASKKTHKEGGGDSKPSEAKQKGGANISNNPSAVQKNKLPPIVCDRNKSTPNQIVFNPNVPLLERPVVALTMAVMNQTILDYDLFSNHRARHTSLGLPGGGVVVGDLAMARYIMAKSPSSSTTPEHDALVNTWVDYAQSLQQMPTTQTERAVKMTLDHNFSNRTYLVGESLTFADVAVFAALGFPSQATDLQNLLVNCFKDSNTAQRWLKMVADHPAVLEATQLALGSSQEAAFGDEVEPLASGMNLLEGGVVGRVVTRFPPEPSGYLHIGHGKAVLLNDYYARRYRGRLIVRFDDTNPSKEKDEYQTSIIQDLAKLGVNGDLVTFTSDYFDTIKEYAIQLIKEGKAYMDDTPQEQMKEERMARQESKHRNSQTEAEALEYFKMMCSGSEEGSAWCLRAKIDMSSVNGTMRDPVLYRQNTAAAHHRTGTRYKAYPTYDLACPLVDSIEGVTHALRTTEYNDRDEQYAWLQNALRVPRKVRIHAFSRVNFNYTVMSKRKLTWFVNEGLVEGWDDARFPTVRGVVRRGIDIQALRDFMYGQGASRNIVQMDWSKFWAENKKYIDKVAKRYMAIASSGEERTELTITTGPSIESYSYLKTAYHPKDPALGQRVIRIANKVWLEVGDAKNMVVGEEFVLVRWGVMKVTAVNDNGLVADFIPNGDFKAAKKKISWIAAVPENTRCVLTEFDNLIKKEKLEEDDVLTDCLTEVTKAESTVEGDALLKTLAKGDIIQLERRGYYRVDQPYRSPEKPVVLFMVPDGKSKAMSGLAGKLAHR
mmetsp:Transcript_26834/g.39710  ORF Transcript_26834/g.39710 Transcript_26834/m.39710 type:complete len:877 (-) Transcript_26834:144-2774(-)|eukprot:CAMPEP_0194201756 /NCGR_PEP_ID=MMETSP0156-20130528/1950_1 /TAXON_ID=33649 /ORGANISM="Thalassionema nitzschioides, Strain L26-B" /LENGTH=876 /DNA_ID=CAMNT_0038927045 /DNA_START=23 /DNA_END=2653 /DNA_ORIENTATION=-